VGKEKKHIAEEVEVLEVPVEKLSDLRLNLPNDNKLDLRVPGILWILQRRKFI